MGKAEKYRRFAVFESAAQNEAAMTEQAKRDGEDLSPEDLDDLVAIANERAEVMTELKAALIEGNSDLVMRVCRKLCGMEEGQGQTQ